MAKTKRTRQDVFADYFSGAWRSADEAKRLRTRTRGAASTCKEVLAIAKNFTVPDQSIVADDLKALQRAYEILEQMGGVFENAQQRSRQAGEKREADRKASNELRVSAVVAELFGDLPSLDAITAFALDLAEFERQIDDFVRANRNAQRGLIDVNGNSGAIRDLASHAKTKDANELARLVAKAWDDINGKGHPHNRTDGGITWFAGKDDFGLWRTWRDQVSAKLASIIKT